MNIVHLILKKKTGEELSYKELEYLIEGYTNDKIPDYQFAAFLMAVNFRGMSDEETYYLTEIMLKSGKILDLSHINKPKIDKHSTGGVGDKISLLLAPAVASFDIAVPMISGRGLAHTGGTLDKLQSIPGFKVDYTTEEFVKMIEKFGFCLIGQTDELAPADKKIYALRDVTGTVECRPLIVASILSKKIAEGAEGIVFDVKIGRGANLSDENESRELAKHLITVAGKFGKKAIAVLTEMDEPIGYKIGNWFEVEECLEVMHGKHIPDLLEINNTLCGAMLKLAGKSATIEEGVKLIDAKIKDGTVYEKFLEMVRMQEGDEEYVKDWKSLKRSKVKSDISAERDGIISKMDARYFGMASIDLGAGRKKVDDSINPHAGIILKKKRGDRVSKGDVICELHADDETKIVHAEKHIHKGLEISDDFVLERKLIIDIFE